MAPRHKATHAVVFIVVRITNTAMDMLRYDSCVPATETDAGQINLAITTGVPQWVILKRFVPMPGGNVLPSVGRWESFGCEIIPSSYFAMHEALTARDAWKKLAPR